MCGGPFLFDKLAEIRRQSKGWPQACSLNNGRRGLLRIRLDGPNVHAHRVNSKFVVFAGGRRCRQGADRPYRTQKSYNSCLSRFNTVGRTHGLRHRRNIPEEDRNPMTRPKVTIDGNEAAAYVAYHVSEVMRHLPDHPLLHHGRVVGRVVRQGKTEHLGHHPHGRRDAERRRRRRRACTARCRPAR